MPPAEGIPAAQRAERSDRVPDAAWEEHRKTIMELYFNMRLEDLVTYMEEKYRFTARQVRSAVDPADHN